METIPHRNELMKPTIEAIQALGGSGSVDEIVEKVISLLQIPDEIVAQPYVTKRGNEDGRTQLEYLLAWVRTDLKQLGILENSARGVWALTGKDLITIFLKCRSRQKRKLHQLIGESVSTNTCRNTFSSRL